MRLSGLIEDGTSNMPLNFFKQSVAFAEVCACLFVSRVTLKVMD